MNPEEAEWRNGELRPARAVRVVLRWAPSNGPSARGLWAITDAQLGCGYHECSPVSPRPGLQCEPRMTPELQRRAGRIVASLFIGVGLLVGLDTVLIEEGVKVVALHTDNPPEGDGRIDVTMFVPLLLAADLLSIGVGTLLMLSAADR